uniref:Putative La1-like peptide n=1 Tax=Superstitionia donensis TaxID=311983 RepID=A0A1V1WBG8_9SCOR
MKYLYFAVFFGCLCSLISVSMGGGEVCVLGGMTIPVGQEKKDPKSCVLYKCVGVNNRVLIEKSVCQPQVKGRGCKSVDGPPSAPFPDCCPTSLCRGKQWDR